MSGITAWATWTSAGVAINAAPALPTVHPERAERVEGGGKLAAWAEAPALNKVHPRARRPHPHSKKAVQLAAAMLGEKRFETLGLVVGTSAGCLEPDLDFQAELSKKGAGFGGPSLFVYTLPTAPPGELSVALNARGPLVALDSGRCSALTAVGIAAREVDAGRAEAMICVAMELGVPDELLALFLVEKSGRTVDGWKNGFGEGGPQGADGALELATALAGGAGRVFSATDALGFWAQVRVA
jgi:3-oxoacyl-(acyl-carrier-protein) synthase